MFSQLLLWCSSKKGDPQSVLHKTDPKGYSSWDDVVIKVKV